MPELTDAQARKLVAMRGGCSCHCGHPPCSQCSDPVTDLEAELLGVESETATDEPRRINFREFL